MFVLFLICGLCFFIVAPLHFRSVEHIKLQKKHGKEKGSEIGRIYGAISGVVESIILIGLWVSPQPRHLPPQFSNHVILIDGLSISILKLSISLPLTVVGAWFGIAGVRRIGLEVAETHIVPDIIVTEGVYSIVRHPQYLGWILAHIGISLLLSAWYSTLFTPILVAFVYLISRKEEYELVKEFGREYEDYRREVPMLIPGWK